MAPNKSHTHDDLDILPVGFYLPALARERLAAMAKATGLGTSGVIRELILQANIRDPLPKLSAPEFRLSLILTPAANDKLDRLMDASGQTAGAVVSRLLDDAAEPGTKAVCATLLRIAKTRLDLLTGSTGLGPSALVRELIMRADLKKPVGLGRITETANTKRMSVLRTLSDNPGIGYGDIAVSIYGIDDDVTRNKVAGMMMALKDDGFVEPVGRGKFKLTKSGAVALNDA